MTMEVINQQIRNALSDEAITLQLQNALSSRADQVARIVDLPEGEAAEKLLEFVVRYIEDVPQMLLDLQAAALEAGLSHYVQPVIQMATEFFVTPPAALSHEAGLAALMDKAYLAHRLLEEVNETYIHRVGQPLIPMDMTLSNVIIHTLIGEPFANDLDQLVDIAVKRLFGPQMAYQSPEFKAFMNRQEASNLVHIWRQWPSMSNEMGLTSTLL
ncbi:MULTISPECIES: hypothetical protein [Oceanospirillaceae]|mgnify:CR=1 FL=1|jgi:hypothetical protein|uniref:hypothetical protein n=1 Tax=Oceanospirillaceae TaxID=135620 RepID=UPI000C459FA8|nr:MULTISPECIES: hypothetical protein [Thalassolituus]MAY14035.1 hypothetical protein [Oceanospirillaceae bacterium]MBU2097808.1 hypothetical protein [Gammaproteobacteria bacterium]PIQ40655.1 MAG: hypothetical protein COW58_04655 [Thalassolituus sp. CG17_big_fil_post_rev_8_21_14_2_50_53_8]MCA6058959.1 hypothetical protein [Thalassolituus sp. ST750PaO-4]MCB2387152.1 hypothetical protein [Thalassolituus alkanivorans]|tara:strand:- start:427 stop:1068 length:642 start_codon:yes stop_codon:yes gene_type:complete